MAEPACRCKPAPAEIQALGCSRAHLDTAPDFSLSPRRRSGERGCLPLLMALLSPALSSLGVRRGSPPTENGGSVEMRRGSPGWFFFFQAEDGIRDVAVTGVQTCALPIWATARLVRSTDHCSGGSASSS